MIKRQLPILFVLIINTVVVTAAENQCRYIFKSQSVQDVLESIDKQHDENILRKTQFNSVSEAKWYQFKNRKLKKVLEKSVFKINNPEKIDQIISDILDYFSPIAWNEKLIPTEKNRNIVLERHARKVLLQEGFENIVKNSGLPYNVKQRWFKKIGTVLSNVLSPWNAISFLKPQMSTEYARLIILKGTRNASENNFEQRNFLISTYFQNYMKTLSQVFILTFLISAQIEQNRAENIRSAKVAEQEIGRLDQIGNIASQFTKESIVHEARRMQVEILLREYEEKFNRLPSKEEQSEIERAVAIGIVP